jgi:hypothetical protein
MLKIALAVIVTVWCLSDPPMPKHTHEVLLALPAPGVGRIGYTQCVFEGGFLSAATRMFNKRWDGSSTAWAPR